MLLLLLLLIFYDEKTSVFLYYPFLNNFYKFQHPHSFTFINEIKINTYVKQVSFFSIDYSTHFGLIGKCKWTVPRHTN